VHREKQPKTAIGIGLGLPPDLPPIRLAAEWLAGLRLLAEAPALADYLSLNLSAAANRRFVGVELRSILLDALAAVADFRSGQEANQRPFLALKLPVDAAPGLWPALVAAGFDQLTVVLPDGAGRLESLARVATLAASGEGPVLVAVGGIRDAVGRQAVCAAGAREVQVHRLFAEAGVATLDRLLAAD
jgi:dihydroorotate dehydrogenase